MSAPKVRRGMDRHEARAVLAAQEAEAAEEAASARAERRARAERLDGAKAARIAQAAALTDADFDGARAVRDIKGDAHQVVRVNRASVTVPGPWGGTRTIPKTQICEVAR